MSDLIIVICFFAIMRVLVVTFLLPARRRTVRRSPARSAPTADSNVVPIRRPVDFEAYDLHRYHRMPPREM